MSLHERSFEYTEAETLRILKEDSGNDEPNNEEEYVPEDDFQAYGSGSLGDEDLNDSDKAGSFYVLIMIVMVEVHLLGNTQPEMVKLGVHYCVQEQCVPIPQTYCE